MLTLESQVTRKLDLSSDILDLLLEAQDDYGSGLDSTPIAVESRRKTFKTINDNWRLVNKGVTKPVMPASIQPRNAPMGGWGRTVSRQSSPSPKPTTVAHPNLAVLAHHHSVMSQKRDNSSSPIHDVFSRVFQSGEAHPYNNNRR
ncbi:hypothetical protein D1872_50630 [compost metagenome]